jgi:hypothetical protein
MGASASKFNPLSPPQKIKSQKDLFLQTKDVREMADQLFTFMYTQYDINEVWDITNKPDDYIIGLTELIENQFHVIGIGPDMSSGSMFFKRFDDLKKKLTSPTADEKAKIRENSKVIAFFFVRIFQILGSMLLIIRETSLELPTLVDEYRGRSANVLPRTFQYGGVIKNETILGPFEFLRNHMSEIDESAREAGIEKKANVLTFRLTKNLYFQFTPVPADMKEIQKDTVNGQSPLPQFILAVKVDGRQRPPISVPIALESISPLYLDNKPFDEYASSNKVQPDQVVFYIKDQKSGQKPRQEQFVVVENVSKSNNSEHSKGKTYTIKRSGDIGGIIAALGLDPTSKLKYVLESFILSYVSRTVQGRVDTLYVKDTTESSSLSSSTRGVGKAFNPEAISIRTIREGYGDLVRSKTVKDGPARGEKIAPFGAHCIKRAVQLLDGFSIENGAFRDDRSKNLKPYTNICKFSAPDVRDSQISLEQYRPTKSVAQLYGKVDPLLYRESENIIRAFVKAEDGPATMETMKVSDLEKQGGEAASLESALKRLRDAFEVTQKGPLDSVRDIKMTIPKECETAKKEADGSIRLENANLINKLQSTAQELLGYHVNSTIKITKFLEKMFNIKKSGQYYEVRGINQGVLFAGFPALNALTDQARELLVDYYSGCETIYQKGVSSWKDANPLPVMAAMAAPDAANAAMAAPNAMAAPAPANAAPMAAPNAKGGRR